MRHPAWAGSPASVSLGASAVATLGAEVSNWPPGQAPVCCMAPCQHFQRLWGCLQCALMPWGGSTAGGRPPKIPPALTLQESSPARGPETSCAPPPPAGGLFWGTPRQRQRRPLAGAAGRAARAGEGAFPPFCSLHLLFQQVSELRS